MRGFLLFGYCSGLVPASGPFRAPFHHSVLFSRERESALVLALQYGSDFSMHGSLLCPFQVSNLTGVDGGAPGGSSRAERTALGSLGDVDLSNNINLG